MKQGKGKNGLSKNTNLQGDIAKKSAVKQSSAPFTKAIGNNSRPMASHSANTPNPGGKLSPKQLAGVGKGK